MISEAHQTRCAALVDVFSCVWACALCGVSNQLRQLLSNFLEIAPPQPPCSTSRCAPPLSLSLPIEICDSSSSDGEDPSPGTPGSLSSSKTELAIVIDDSFDVEILDSTPGCGCFEELDDHASPSLHIVGVDQSIEALFKQHLVNENLHNLQMRYRNPCAARRMPPQHRTMITTMAHPFGPCTWYIHPEKREAIVHFMTPEDAYEALSCLRSHLPAAIFRIGPNQAPHWSVLAADTCGRAE